MAGRRDRYGRYRGNGGIKAYKSNLPTMKAGKGRKRTVIKASGGKRTAQGGWSKKKKIAVGVAVAGAATASSIVARNALRENALKKRHGEDYLPKTVTGYHYAYGNGQRQILKTQSMKSKQKYGLPGTSTGIWFTNDGSSKHRASMTAQYGDNVIKTKFKRSVIERNVTPFKDKSHKWLMVDRKDLKSKFKPHRIEPVDPAIVARAKRIAKGKK